MKLLTTLTFLLSTAAMAQTPYRFVCTDYVSTDNKRAPQSAFAYDTKANTMSITAKGTNNIAFKMSMRADGEYSIRQDQTWFTVVGSNISSDASQTALWWINGVNNPGCKPDKAVSHGNQTALLWNLAENSALASAFDFSKPSLTLGTGISQYPMALGTTATDQSSPGIISDVNYYATYEAAATYPFLMDVLGTDSTAVAYIYKKELTSAISEASSYAELATAVSKAQTALDNAGETDFAACRNALQELQQAIDDFADKNHTYSYNRTSDGLKATIDSLNITIAFLNDSTVRVLKTYDSDYSRLSRVVLPSVKEDVNLSYAETDTTVCVSSAAASVVYNRQSGLVNILRTDGSPLIAEQGLKMQPFMDGTQPSYTVTQKFTLDSDERIYGLGQIQDGRLNERGQSVLLAQANTSICIPYFQSSKNYALYWDNYSPTSFSDDDYATTFRSTGRASDYYVLVAGNSAGVLKSLRHLTGETRQPALWNFGFYQSKERYSSADEVMGVMKKYRDLNVPIDCVVQDWQYWGDNAHWNAMDFLAPAYADYQQMIDSIHAMHGKLMITIWPDFGPQTEQAKYLKSMGRLLPPESYPTGEDVHAYDAYDEGARDYYWKMLYKGLACKGIDAYWLDSTEPDYYGSGGSDYDYMTGAGETWRALRNVYPLATVEGVYDHHRAQTELSDKRVSIMTRSGFLGMQRTGAYVWSADITSSWGVLANQIPAACNLSVCGLPYWNSDTGGFFTGSYRNGVNDESWVRLYQRWTQFSTFTPMLRFHGTNTPREIWQFGEEGDNKGVYDNLLKYIRLRYRLVPYLYSTAHQIVENGESFMNSLPFAFEHDAKGYDIKDEYMLGQSVLVAPVVNDGVSSRNVYLPAGQSWYDFWSGKRYGGGQTVNRLTPMDIIPVYIKAGTVMPWGPEVQYTSEKPWDNLEIRVYTGADGSFTLYEDEGDNYNYENGAFTEIPFAWDNANHTLTIGKRTGSYDGMLQSRQFRIVIVGEDKGTGDGESTIYDKTVSYDGQPQVLTFDVVEQEDDQSTMEDMTNLIVNSSFEADGKALTKTAPQGWTVDSNTAWWGVNEADDYTSMSDPVATDGKYIFGVWDSGNTAVPEISQVMTSLTAGDYVLTVDMHASNRSNATRVGKQCLFANDRKAYFKDQVQTAGTGDNYPMQTLTLEFTVENDNDAVEIGVSTQDAPAETWFKIDNFRLYRKSHASTAVNSVSADRTVPDGFYTLDGMRLTKAPAHGIYISGKKKLFQP